MTSSAPQIPASAEASLAPAPASPTKNQVRSGRPRPTRAKTLRARKVPAAVRLELLQGGGEPPEEGDPRPRTRGECQGGARPCPYVSCAHHLYLDVTVSGSIKFNFPDLEVSQMRESCALDAADRGGLQLEQVAARMNLTRERARQLQEEAFDKPGVRPAFAAWRDDVRTRRRRRLPVLQELGPGEEGEDADEDLDELVEGDLSEEPLG